MMIPMIAAGFLKASLLYGAIQAPDMITTEIAIRRGVAYEANPLGATFTKRLAMSGASIGILTIADQGLGKKSKKAQKIFRLTYIGLKILVVSHNSKIAFGKR